MFDPQHNALPSGYFLVNGPLTDSWKGLDKDVGIMNWRGGENGKNCQFFANLGLRQMLVGYYDDDDAGMRIRGWLANTKDMKGISGVMYTTWQDKYYAMDAWAQAAWGQIDEVKGERRKVRTDIRPVGTELYFLPVETRVPLKFGPETLTYVTCARVKLTVEDRVGRRAEGWGETPLSVQWVWPSALSYEERHEALKDFTRALAAEWASPMEFGHPMEVGHAFLEARLPKRLEAHNADARRAGADAVAGGLGVRFALRYRAA